MSSGTLRPATVDTDAVGRGVDLLQHYSNLVVKQNKEMAEFLDQRSLLQMTYAHDLRTLTDKFQEKQVQQLSEPDVFPSGGGSAGGHSGTVHRRSSTVNPLKLFKAFGRNTSQNRVLAVDEDDFVIETMNKRMWLAINSVVEDTIRDCDRQQHSAQLFRNFILRDFKARNGELEKEYSDFILSANRINKELKANQSEENVGYQVKLLNKAEDKLMFAEEIRINTILALLTGYGKTKVQELSELELAIQDLSARLDVADLREHQLTFKEQYINPLKQATGATSVPVTPEPTITYSTPRTEATSWHSSSASAATAAVAAAPGPQKIVLAKKNDYFLRSGSMWIQQSSGHWKKQMLAIDTDKRHLLISVPGDAFKVQAVVNLADYSVHDVDASIAVSRADDHYAPVHVFALVQAITHSPTIQGTTIYIAADSLDSKQDFLMGLGMVSYCCHTCEHETEHGFIRLKSIQHDTNYKCPVYTSAPRYGLEALMETYKSRMVEVRISQAISLHEIFSEKKLKGALNTYCVISCTSLQHNSSTNFSVPWARTDVKENNMTPAWEKTFQLRDCYHQFDNLVVTLYSRKSSNWFQSDVALGQTVIPLTTTLHNMKWFLLSDVDTGKQFDKASVLLSFTVNDMTVLPLEEYGLLLHLLMDMSRGPQLYHLLLNNEHDLTDEMMALTESIVISYGGIGRLSEFVSGLMYAEIAATKDVTQLFRKPGVALRMSDRFLRQFAVDWILGAIADPMKKIALEERSLEIDADAIADGENVTQNVELLRTYVSMIWASLMSSTANCPTEVRFFLSNMHKQLLTLFVGKPNTAIGQTGGFLFNRFIVRLISETKTSATGPLSPIVQKNLKSVGVCLQKLCNLTQSRQSKSSLYFPVLEPLLKDYEKQFVSFVNEIVTQKDNLRCKKLRNVLPDIRRDVATLHAAFIELFDAHPPPEMYQSQKDADLAAEFFASLQYISAKVADMGGRSRSRPTRRGRAVPVASVYIPPAPADAAMDASPPGAAFSTSPSSAAAASPPTERAFLNRTTSIYHRPIRSVLVDEPLIGTL